MATPSNPLTALPTPPERLVKLYDLLKRIAAPVAQPLNKAVSSGRQAYVGGMNKVLKSLSEAAAKYTDETTKGLSGDENDAYASTPKGEQAIETGLRAGVNAIGIPAPEHLPIVDDRQILQSVVPPLKLPKGKMEVKAIQSAIEDAADAKNTLYITYKHPEWDEAKIYHVEPYSFRGKDNQTLMAYDKMQKGIRAFKLENVVNAKVHSDVNFEPRWNVEITGAKDPKSIIEGQGLVYKGEAMKGSGVHRFEDPNNPGKTASMKAADITPDSVSAKMQSKLKELGVSPKVESSGIGKVDLQFGPIGADIRRAGGTATKNTGIYMKDYPATSKAIDTMMNGNVPPMPNEEYKEYISNVQNYLTKNASKLNLAEQAAEKMSSNEIDILAYGEESDQKRIVKKYGASARALAKILADSFEK